MIEPKHFFLASYSFCSSFEAKHWYVEKRSTLIQKASWAEIQRTPRITVWLTGGMWHTLIVALIHRNDELQKTETWFQGRVYRDGCRHPVQRFARLRRRWLMSCVSGSRAWRNLENTTEDRDWIRHLLSICVVFIHSCRINYWNTHHCMIARWFVDTTKWELNQWHTTKSRFLATSDVWVVGQTANQELPHAPRVRWRRWKGRMWAGVEGCDGAEASGACEHTMDFCVFMFLFFSYENLSKRWDDRIQFISLYLKDRAQPPPVVFFTASILQEMVLYTPLF